MRRGTACLALTLAAACSGPRLADSEDFGDLRYGDSRDAVIDTLDADLLPSLTCFGRGPQGRTWRAEACSTSDTAQTYILLFTDDILVSVVPKDLADEQWAAQFSAPDRLVATPASLEALGQALLDQRLDPASTDFSAEPEPVEEEFWATSSESDHSFLAGMFYMSLTAALVPEMFLLMPIGLGWALYKSTDHVDEDAFYAPLAAFTGATTPPDLVATLGEPSTRISEAGLDVCVDRPVIRCDFHGDSRLEPVSLAFREDRLFWVIWNFDALYLVQAVRRAQVSGGGGPG